MAPVASFVAKGAVVLAGEGDRPGGNHGESLFDSSYRCCSKKALIFAA